MKFDYIVLDGFKKYKEKTRFDFGKITCIGGENFTGKTTIGEGIVFAIYGINMRGETRRSEELINNESEVAVVELGFTDDMGGKHTIVRIKDYKTSSVSLDDKKNTTQKDINHIFGEPKFFLSCFTVHYFNMFMADDKERRDLLSKFAPVIDYARLFGELSDINLINKYSIKLHDRKESARFSKLKNEVEQQILGTRREIQLLYQQNNEDKEPSEKLKPIYDKQEAEIKAKIEEFRSLEKTNIAIKLKLEKYNQDIEKAEEIENTISSLHKDLEQKYGHIGKLSENKQYKKLIEARNSLVKYAEPKHEDISDLSDCPFCGTNLTNEYKEKIKEKRLNELEEIRKHNSDVDSKRIKIEDAIKKMEEEEKAALKILAEINTLEKNKITNIEKPEENVVDISELPQLEEKYTKILEYNRIATQINSEIKSVLARRQKRTEQIVQLERNISDFQKQLDEYSEIWKALSPTTGIHRKAMEERAKSIQQELTNCKIILERQQKDGGIDECFEIYYENRPYRLCSTSEQMMASMEIAKFLRNRSGKNIPMFIDQAESITCIPEDYKKDLEQLFICSVVKGHKGLKLLIK